MKLKLLAMSALFSTSCGNGYDINDNELVMCKGDWVKAQNEHGTLFIKAVSDISRSYKFNKFSVETKLKPRISRWNGSLGLYRSAGENDVHMVINEGVQHFYSVEEAENWAALRNKKYKYSIGENGLLVGWYTIPNEQSGGIEMLGVEIWKIVIQNSSKSLSMVTANGVNIKISENFGACQADTYGYMPSMPSAINGKRYSGRALDLMKEYNIDTNVVTEIISKGELTEKDGIKTYLYSEPNSLNLFWVKLDNNGNIIMIGR